MSHWMRGWGQTSGRARLTFLLVGAVVLVFAVLVGASKVEENDAFCASCHRAPEVRYVARARAAHLTPDDPSDLASRHAIIPARCVDCHRGDGSLVHRVTALALGARNAAQFVMGQGEEGRTRLLWLPEASCTRCHADVLNQPSFEKHFHNLLPKYEDLPQVRSKPENRVLCVQCHPSHRKGEVLTGFIEDEVVFPVCEKCHQVWGKGPKRMGR